MHSTSLGYMRDFLWQSTSQPHCRHHCSQGKATETKNRKATRKGRKKISSVDSDKQSRPKKAARKASSEGAADDSASTKRQLHNRDGATGAYLELCLYIFLYCWDSFCISSFITCTEVKSPLRDSVHLRSIHIFLG